MLFKNHMSNPKFIKLLDCDKYFPRKKISVLVLIYIKILAFTYKNPFDSVNELYK